MADQSVKITHMPDNSEARVAYEMTQWMVGLLPKKDGVDRIEQVLHLFTACRRAAQAYSFDVSKLR